jgi:putative transposase
VPKEKTPSCDGAVAVTVDLVPRPLRSFEPGGFYHLTARGNDRRDIVLDDHDRTAFVVRLARTCVRFRIDVRAWCLMTNHYHLLVETPSGEVSRAIQYLNGTYAAYFNERHDRTGHLFSGRFRATILEDEQHLEAASAYVLLNPVRARLVPTAEDWRWAGAVGSPA